jgi:hypothetical protein
MQPRGLRLEPARGVAPACLSPTNTALIASEQWAATPFNVGHHILMLGGFDGRETTDEP